MITKSFVFEMRVVVPLELPCEASATSPLTEPQLITSCAKEEGVAVSVCRVYVGVAVRAIAPDVGVLQRALSLKQLSA